MMVDVKKVADLRKKIDDGLSQVIVGREELRRALLVALLAGGHVLIEGLPGTGKTTLAKTFATLIGGKFKRIQCVPDMLPSDITGFYMYSLEGIPKLVDGPIFTNILLVDELNRVTPRTQAALLESMQERQVTIERETFPLPQQFMVVATQQQLGAEGTYPLTNVQIDRFLIRQVSSHSTREEEAAIISNIDRIDEPAVEAVTSLAEIEQAQRIARNVHISPQIIQYITSLTEALRLDPDLAIAPSTRGAIAMYKSARVMALLDGREYVIPDDVKQLFFSTIEHRVGVRAEAEMDNMTPHVILERTLEKVPVPK